MSYQRVPTEGEAGGFSPEAMLKSATLKGSPTLPAITEAGDVGEPLSIADFDVATGANPPASPSVGTLWYDTNNLALMVYIDDGNSLQWVQAN